MLIDSGTDGHMHTSLCNHAQGSMEEYAEAALARGLRRIFFLEHLEVGIRYFETTWLSEADFSFYFEEGARLREKYQGRLEIGLGVEVGYNPDREKEILAFLARHSFDRVGVSYHFLDLGGRHANMVSRKQVNMEELAAAGVDTVIRRYLRDLRQAVLALPGDVVCHCDAVLRHLPGLRFPAEATELFEELLDAVAARGMALEVNTSGFALRNEQFPALDLLRRAVARGIPLWAGSDAHRPGDVGRYFERLQELGARLGD